MRMWLVDPVTMCRKHLMGEHVEIHMFAGAIRQGTSMVGYLLGNMLEPKALQRRHDELAAEMERRGYRHDSPLCIGSAERKSFDKADWRRRIDREAARAELHRRCPECRQLYQEITG